jgi:hypothetical protein
VLVGEDHSLYSVAEAELGEHPGDVGFYSGLGDKERGRDLRVRQAGGKQPENLGLPRGQPWRPTCSISPIAATASSVASGSPLI